MPERSDLGEAFRASIAGAQAAKLIGAATAIFRAGGNKLLSEASQNTLRAVVERGAEKAIATATGPLLPPGLSPLKLLGSGARATSAVVKGGVRLAAREIAKGAGKAAGIGFVVDGAVATVEGVLAVRAGAMNRGGAMKHVAKEATTGAIATGAGVLLGATVVALTGGVAAPVVFAIGAIGSIGTKRALRKWIG